MNPRRVVGMLRDFMEHAEGAAGEARITDGGMNVGEERVPRVPLGAPHTRDVRCFYLRGNLGPRVETWDDQELQATTTTREREAPSQPPEAGATSARAEKGERRKHKAPPQPTTTPTDQAKGRAISEAVAYH